MSIKKFIKEKILITVLLLFAIASIEIFLIPYPYGNFIKIYIPGIILSVYIIGNIIEYFIKKSFYKKLINDLNELDQKYLITEIIQKPDFFEGELLIDILQDINKSMYENVNKYKYMGEEYKDYIELWIHEIKIPIASGKMIIENNKNEITKSIEEELDKVENYIEQALFYARSNTVEKDYYIKTAILKEIVNESIKKNKKQLMNEKISLDLHDLDIEVKTDNKWIVFILNQIVQNSIKYRKQDSTLEIEIYAQQGKNDNILYIKDNGIGIKKGEITRVFEKGFTGTNGRLSNKKSTGIGLYLCKKLCEKIGIAIELNSVQNEGTEIRIVFPNDSHIDMN